MIKIAINGYGRIGRNVLRALYESGRDKTIKIVAINELAAPEAMVHLTRFDTSHGRFRYPVQKKFAIAVFVYLAVSVFDGVYLYLPFMGMLALNFLGGVFAVTSYNIRISSTQNYLPDEIRGRFNGLFQMLTIPVGAHMVGRAGFRTGQVAPSDVHLGPASDHAPEEWGEPSEGEPGLGDPSEGEPTLGEAPGEGQHSEASGEVEPSEAPGEGEVRDASGQRDSGREDASGQR